MRYDLTDPEWSVFEPVPPKAVRDQGARGTAG
jgi:transposase